METKFSNWPHLILREIKLFIYTIFKALKAVAYVQDLLFVIYRLPP